MNKYWPWYAWLFLCCGPLLTAQNLVPNPGFESYSMCPPYPGQVHLAQPWDSPNNKTTDFFHRCSPGTAGVPNNLLGVQQPFRGDGYLGLRVWTPVIPGNPPYREYATVPLLDTLEAGREYSVSFWLSMAERSSHHSDGLGLWFSKDYPLADSAYTLKADVRFPNGELIRSLDDWIPVRGVYQAKGGESFLTIGNFLTDETMVRKLERPDEQPTVYYFLDEDAVMPCPITPMERIIDTTICRGESILLKADSSAWAVSWDNGSGLVEWSISGEGSYVVTHDYGCFQQDWLFRVHLSNCDCRFGQRDPSGKPGSWVFPSELQDFSIRVFDARGRFLGTFSTLDFVAFAKNLSSGMYFFRARLTCVAGEAPIQQSGQFVIVAH